MGDFDERAEDLTRRHGLGGTGRFPEGKIREGDKGELKGGLTVDHEAGLLMLVFGEPVTWLTMTRDEAMSFAAALVVKARTLPEADAPGPPRPAVVPSVWRPPETK